MADDWDSLARSIGYANEKSMLEDFYLGEEMAVSEIGRRLGHGTATIARRLSMCGIEKRGRGGPNNTASQKRKLFHMDQRWVMMLDLGVVASMARASKSTIYKFRRSITGGKISEILHNQSFDRPEPVFDPQFDPLAPPPGGKPDVH